MSTNYASSINMEVEGRKSGFGGAIYQNGGNSNIENVIWRSTIYNNYIQNVNYKANPTYYCNQNIVVPPENYNFVNEKWVGGANATNLFPSTNLIQPSHTSPPSILNNFIRQQTRVGGQESNIIYKLNNFNGVEVK